MTDCSSIHGSTTSSSDIISSRSCTTTATTTTTTTNPRIRIIRMIRPNSRRVLIGPDNNSSFGFAIRGGKEFGTGFFVSKVEKGSEADIKGLRVGDQIIRANGYNVDDAIHKELTQFISSQDRLTLKVRGVGMLPVKEKIIDPLSWHIVPRHTLTSVTDLEEMRIPQKDIRIVLKVAPRTKLGLGICKGPEWKPGIFVQFTKEFSVARDAGLRPGDQILSCNSIDFSDVLFSEAVAVMKSSQMLEMVVRTGAGLDLFPGESSGYNSSASSVTGDQSPCWGDHSSKRLSIVREESSLDKFGLQSKYWYNNGTHSLYRQKDRSSIGSESSSSYANESDGNKTIIRLSENGTLINNTLVADTKSNEIPKNHSNGFTMDNLVMNRSYNDLSSTSSTLSSSLSNEENVKRNSSTLDNISPSNNVVNNTSVNTDKPEDSNNKVNGKIADICFVSRQSETKTVIVEVHRSATTEEANRSSSLSSSSSSSALPTATGAPVPPPKPPPTSSFSSTSTNDNSNTPERSPSVASSCGTSSLSSAISEELKKRQERRCINQGSNQTHANGLSGKQSETQLRSQPPITSTMKKFGNPSLGGNDDEKRHNALMDEFKRAHRRMFKNGFQEEDTKERQAELNKINTKKDETDHHQQQQHSQNGISSSKTGNNNSDYSIPPPPPPQFANSIGSQRLQSHLMSQYKLNELPPLPTPTPDYDSTPTHTIKRNGMKNHNSSSSSSSSSSLPPSPPSKINGIMNGTNKTNTIGRIANEIAKANGDVVELESIESYKLQNSESSTIPKPPAMYFTPQSSGPPTMKKTTRNVAITIGEYGGGQNQRKEPSKLDFISKANNQNNEIHNSSYTNGISNNTYYSNGTNGSNGNSSLVDNHKSDNVSEKLRHELEKTLSRSNLKKRNDNNESNSNLYITNCNNSTITNDINNTNNNDSSTPLAKIINNGKSNSSILKSSPSPNIEKLANMLQNRYRLNDNNDEISNNHNNYHHQHHKSATMKSSNKVTISIPNKQELRMTESAPLSSSSSAAAAASTPMNGILKSCYTKSSNYGEKSITFGNN